MKFHYGNTDATLNLAEVLENNARARPQAIATICLGSQLTYAETNTAANRFANGLRNLGVGEGDRVAVMLPNIPEFVIAYFAVLKLGGTVVPMNTMFRQIEIRYILEDSQAKAMIVWEPVIAEALKALPLCPSCRHCIAVGDNPPPGTLALQAITESSPSDLATCQTRETDTAVILYTSGTTGRSKGAELTHFNMHCNATAVADMIDIQDSDRFVATLPLFHSFGQTHVMNATFARGGSIILHPRFEASRVLESFQRDGATLFAGVPTMYFYLLQAASTEGIAANSLRLCISGGAPLPVPVLHEFEKRFGAVILEGYGLSETSPVACSNRPDRARKPGSIGIPIPGAEMRIFDDRGRELPANEVGEVVIRGPLIMKGYLNEPEATAEAMRDDWFHSGDLGYHDEDGYFYIVDRKKDMILKSGYNVYPREVEEILYRHPAVAEAAVVGVPDVAKGEEVKAYVALKADVAASEEGIVDHCRKLLSAYKCPKYVEFLPSLPKSATGKILRRELRNPSS